MSDLFFSSVIDSPLGKLGIRCTPSHLTQLSFLSAEYDCHQSKNPLDQQVIQELRAYFANPQHVFTIPLQPKGSPFQHNVWQHLQQLPVSKTQTYGELAKALKTGPRAIGQACRTNQIAIIIPCHRILARHHAGGYMGTLSGQPLERKRWLLKHEQNFIT